MHAKIAKMASPREEITHEASQKANGLEKDC